MMSREFTGSDAAGPERVWRVILSPATEWDGDSDARQREGPGVTWIAAEHVRVMSCL